MSVGVDLYFVFQAVVRPSGGHAVVLNWSMYNIYGMHPHEVGRLISIPLIRLLSIGMECLCKMLMTGFGVDPSVRRLDSWLNRCPSVMVEVWLLR